MIATPHRTTRQERRLVLVLLTLTVVASALAMLAMGTEARFVLPLPAAALAISTGSVAAGRARVTPGRAFLPERIVLTIVIWIGLSARSLDPMPFVGRNSAAAVGVWFLGGTWAWAALGAGAFGVKRLYEREAALARLARRRGSRQAAPWLVPVLTYIAALAAVTPLLLIRADLDLILASALCAAVGALLVQRGFPAGVRSSRGRCWFSAGAFALGAAVSTFGTLTARPFVFMVSSAPPKRQLEIGDWLALAGSYTLLGAWLFFFRPFAKHEWRLALSSEKGLR